MKKASAIHTMHWQWISISQSDLPKLSATPFGSKMIEEPPRRRLVSSILLTVVLGFFAIAILGLGPGLVCAGLIFIALMVALNL